MLEQFFTLIFGSKNKRDLKHLIPLVTKINSLEPEMMALKDEQFVEKTGEFKQRLKGGESLDKLLPEAFALAREAARRILGERPFDVQLMGGISLHEGKIMEMKTGEGKTLSSVPAAYLNALTEKGVHMVTVNDYLAKRDAQWMKPVYDFLGITVGAITSDMDPEARKTEYDKDITYGTNNEFGFDYLRDNLKWDPRMKVQREHHYCIIDEIDSILIDEARTPLIISGPAEDDTRHYYAINRMVDSLKECDKDPETGEYPEEPLGDYKLEEKSKRILFTDEGMNHMEELLQSRGLINGSLFESDNFEYVHYVTQCLKAHKLFTIDVDYIVQDGKVQIVDEFTGRVLYGRRYSDGLHQAIEAKENIKVAQRNRTLATITFQNYFRLYSKISGMTGTADTEAKEFAKIYNLEVVVVPTNRPVMRIDQDDLIYVSEKDKLNAICDDIAQRNKKGQPVLVGTVSIEKSEQVAAMLRSRGVRHEILNAKNHAREALIIAEAGAKGAVTIATNMAGRGTDIKLGGNPESRARRKTGTDATEEVFREAYQKEFSKWQNDYNEVKTLGGLYVLGTERHESRRIDNQLRGRSGRQGDPGESRFYISLDDTLMRLFGGDGLKNFMANMGMGEGEAINHRLLNRSLEKAQSRVEERNFDIRKHLLEYDDVLNEQRRFIYERRDALLTDPNLTERVIASAGEIVEDIMDTYKKARDEDKSRAETEFLTQLKDNFMYTPEFSPELLEDFKALEEKIMEDLKADVQNKVQEVGSEQLNLFIRHQYLRNIDLRWQDHLENLDALKEAVYLRAYGQKNPLLEYKLEGFSIFDQMLEEIRLSIARMLLKVQVKVEKDKYSRQRGPQGNATHNMLNLFAGGASGRGGERAEARGATTMQVKRTQPKVGRNDPCPCGSGKKYKKCHGLGQ